MATQTHKRITINDIAKMASTSKTTVSFYLNGKTDRMSEATRARIAAVIEKTGYEPSPLARGMNSKRSRMMGVIIGDITNSFSNQLVKGVADAANERNYSLLVSSSNFNPGAELNYIDRLLAVGVDGFIVQPTAQSMSLIQEVKNAGRKLVFLDSNVVDTNAGWVKADTYEASWRAISACCDKGYEKFLIVCAEPGLITSRIERFGGFAEAVQSHGKTYQRYQFEGTDIQPEKLAAFLRENIDGVTPTLVFVPNCWALPEIYTLMHPYFDLMPDTVGLMGFDNTEWAQLASPSVSAIVQPAFEEGYAACNMLATMIEEEQGTSQHQVLPCDIVWGASTR